MGCRRELECLEGSRSLVRQEYYIAIIVELRGFEECCVWLWPAGSRVLSSANKCNRARREQACQLVRAVGASGNNTEHTHYWAHVRAH